MRLGRFSLEDEMVIALLFEEQWIPLRPPVLDSSLAQDMLALLEAWPSVKPGLMAALRQDRPRPLSDHARPQLPFQPASLRDFLLSETHAINAARGLARRYMPKAALVVRLFESVTGRVFPALKPKPIWYRQPIYYFGNHLNVVTDGAVIQWPDYTADLDYELELALVITKPLYNATPQEALSAVGGFLVLNDFSARDVQMEEMRSGFGPQKSKHFLNALSHTVATADDLLPNIHRLNGEVRINGRRVCASSTAEMRYSIPEVLSHISRGERMHPGEVLGLGTLPGGCALENGHWPKPGDHIELIIEQVGSLRNTIAG